jgi:acyl-CoA dehydrogenase
MEVLERFASAEHCSQWLDPLMAGEIRSAYLMTEPQVASSDATNIAMRCVRDGDHYLVSGEKVFITSGMRADFFTVAVRTDPAQRGAGGRCCIAGVSLHR